MTEPKPHLFEEGQVCDFVINSRIQLPPDDENYLVLTSSFNTKHLLQEKYYLDYNLQPGQKIICRIDKINCTGKIYLEPEHPYYKVNNVYDFIVKSVEHIVNSTGKSEKMIVVDDFLHNHIYINVSNNDLDDVNTIKCRVDRIKKGKIYLTPLGNQHFSEKYDIGNEYEFRIDSIVTLAEDEEYYVLKDVLSSVHYLRKKYFQDYSFEIGSIITCRVTAQPALFRHYLEPIHPHYKIGEVYEFLYSGTDSYTNEVGKEITKIMVTDGSEKDFFVNCDKLSNLQILPETKIKCRIKGYKMGRPILECI